MFDSEIIRDEEMLGDMLLSEARGIDPIWEYTNYECSDEEKPSETMIQTYIALYYAGDLDENNLDYIALQLGFASAEELLEAAKERIEYFEFDRNHIDSITISSTTSNRGLNSCGAGFDRYGYYDELKIQKDSIEYKRYNCFTKELVNSWSQKKYMCSDDNWEKLLDRIVYLKSNPNDRNGNFVMTIHEYSDVAIYGSNTFKNSHLEHIAKIIKDMLPKWVLYPQVLD